MAVSRRVTRVAAVMRGWDETRRGSAATPADPGPVDVLPPGPKDGERGHVCVSSARSVPTLL